MSVINLFEGEEMEKVKELLENRSKCLLYNAVEDSFENFGWIGGNPPEYFDDKISMFNNDNIEYRFYLTFNNPINNENAFSIFIPKKYSDRIDNNRYPNCSLKIFEHKISAESENSILKMNEINRHYLKFIEEVEEEKFQKQYTEEFNETVDDSYSALVKFGGNPVLIQEEVYYYEQLLDDGYVFLFQIDEDGYPDSLVSEYPFGYGALYVYGKMNNGTTNDVIVGYWQFS